MTIAVIIPVLNEACGIGQTLSHTATLGFDELIIVDGGSSDQTCAVVESCAGRLQNRPCSGPAPASPTIRLLKAAAGRARQLNAGAAGSRCEVLLFLHADTYLPTERPAGHLHRAVRRGLRRRTLRRPLRLPSSDSPTRRTHDESALPLERHCHRRPGPLRPTGCLRADRTVCGDPADGRHRVLPSPQTSRAPCPIAYQVVTAFRRWERNGPVRTILLMWTLRFLYWIGVSPYRLQHFYSIVR
jgi:glycosyltransferase involved in cell wall biosynthesis